MTKKIEDINGEPGRKRFVITCAECEYQRTEPLGGFPSVTDCDRCGSWHTFIDVVTIPDPGVTSGRERLKC